MLLSLCCSVPSFTLLVVCLAHAHTPQYDRLFSSGKKREEIVAKLVEESTGKDWKTGERLFVPKVRHSGTVTRPTGVTVWDMLFAKRHSTVDVRKSMEEEALKARLALGTSRCVPSYFAAMQSP